MTDDNETLVAERAHQANNVARQMEQGVVTDVGGSVGPTLKAIITRANAKTCPMTKKQPVFGCTISPKATLSRAIRKIIFGKWARKDLADRVPKFT